MGVVTVVARLTAHPGKVEDLVALTGPLIRATRAEAGCLRYDLARGRENPDELVFVEEWESADALAKHLASQHIGAFREAAGEVLAASDVTTYEDVDAVRTP